MKEWVNAAIATLLRTGVVVSVVIILIGTVMTFAGHPEYFSARPDRGAHFPNTLTEVIAGVRQGNGEAIIMAGLLVLIVTPVARVALSMIIFIIARDRLYTAITSAVLLILLISFAVGLVAR